MIINKDINKLIKRKQELTRIIDQEKPYKRYTRELDEINAQIDDYVRETLEKNKPREALQKKIQDWGE